MKIFVGTLFCGENDFETSKKAIQNQKNVTITHHIIQNLPEYEAHNSLWDAWDSSKETHDLFVKVDADTTLIRDDTLFEISKLFENNDRLTGVQCYLDDYFTDTKIFGLNCYSKKVSFNQTGNKLYCDRVDGNHDIVLRGNHLPDVLNPAGLHCHEASDVQAFHYGLHRRLKNQTQNIENVKLAWSKHNDRLRWFVLRGAENLVAAQFINRSFDYNDDFFQAVFETYKARCPYDLK